MSLGEGSISTRFLFVCVFIGFVSFLVRFFCPSVVCLVRRKVGA
jgi:hypothetical protein